VVELKIKVGFDIEFVVMTVFEVAIREERMEM
jgi:hypothetical protein